MSSAPSSKFIFATGLLIGGVVGVLAMVAFGPSVKEPIANGEPPAANTRSRPASDPHARNPHARNPHAKDPHGRKPPAGHGGAGPGRAGHGGADRATSSFAKVHFMKKFVKALKETPANNWPNADYEPLLKDPKKPFGCADCHDPRNFNMEGMLRHDPGEKKVEPYRKNPNFMIPLMKKWVTRLNRLHADKLTKPVTCTSCHAIDPLEARAVLPPLMARFTAALSERPKNENPAPNWRPLLKDTSAGVKNCALCHGEVGKRMESEAPEYLKQAHSAKHHGDKAFMVDLMTRWVERLNREAADKLVKKVTCLDCHADDPR